MKKQLPAWLALAIISLMAGLLLALTNALTQDRIAAQGVQAANEARIASLSAAETFEPQALPEKSALSGCYAGLKDGKVVGYVSEISVKGYGGPIAVTAGMDLTGALTGVSVGGDQFKETAGLGAKTKDTAFTGQFIGKQTPLELKKDIDSVAGATISSGAVVSGVNKMGDYMKTLLPGYVSEDTGATNAVETRVVTVKGYGGDIEVGVGLAADGTIASLDVGGPNFAETTGLGEKATEKAFRDQFIGKSGQLRYGEGIDAIAGATITSNAVMDAVNQALQQGPVAAPALMVETVKGYGGDIEVSVGLAADGTIASLDVGGPNFAETTGLGEKATEKAFRDQFIGKSGQLRYGEGIDAIAGATITSNAVMDAVNKILANAGSAQPAVPASAQPAAVEPVSTPEPTVEPTPEPTVEPTPEPTAKPTPVPAAETAAMEAPAETVTVKGFASDIDVTVALNEDGTIQSVTVGGANFNETPGLGEKAKDEAFTGQFVGKRGPFKYGEGVDAIAGATVTSDAVLGAINQLVSEGASHV
ncbi:FMN-binding protein [Bacillota bacterium Meth-B3]|nr:FMN-binding protein [Christensenellaceae bacterium]